MKEERESYSQTKNEQIKTSNNKYFPILEKLIFFFCFNFCRKARFVFLCACGDKISSAFKISEMVVLLNYI